MHELIITAPKGEQQHIVLIEKEYIIGRDPKVTITLSDSKISRQHARIFRKGKHYWLEDLGSANGVIVNEQPISQAIVLSPTTRFRIGGFNFNCLPSTTSIPTQSFSLVGLSPSYENKTFVLPSGQLSVGRTHKNAVVVAHPSISRKHAYLDVSGAGVRVEDLKSSNGTWVNNERILQQNLIIGDRVRFGDIEFEFLPVMSNLGLNILNRLWYRLRRTERTLQIAGVIALLSVALIITTIVLALIRSSIFSGNRLQNTPHQLEMAYEKAIQKDLSLAQKYMQAEVWEQALLAFQKVLDRDPINKNARAGMELAQINQFHQQIIKQARTKLAQKDAQTANRLLKDIRPDAYYAKKIKNLKQNIRKDLEKTLTRQAHDACRTMQWLTCHQFAVELVDLNPASILAQALIYESEMQMTFKNETFTPWHPVHDVQNSMPARLAAFYPQAELRSIATRYAAGDIATALQLARKFRKRGLTDRLYKHLLEIQKAKTEGDGAAVAQYMDKAVKLWETAWNLDFKILPETYPSMVRADLQVELSQAWWQKGRTQADRGKDRAAFRCWNKALTYDPTHKLSLQNIDALERKADSIFASLFIKEKGHQERCQRLKDIIAITRSTALVHQQAEREITKACKK